MLRGLIWLLSEVHLVVVIRTMNQCKYQVNSNKSRPPNIIECYKRELHPPTDDRAICLR